MAGGLSAALVVFAEPPQAIAEQLETPYSTHQSALSPEQSLLSPQPIDVSAIPRTLDWPTAAPVLPEVQLPTRLVIRLSERRVYVYRGNEVETSFPVAVGRGGWETPTGEFQVFSMLENPGWTNPFTNEVTPPGPDNPLGDRWIAFWTDGNNQIGFHGTPNRDSVGSAASHGCIRLYNEHIQELYELVDIGTTVTVEP
ncbi:MAG: L,D-transpeptidase [Leptolyngbya sp. SIO1D8]|nr:L,D-transpeptidase [Leptolyngbya sp. SIO1D8]